MNDEGPQLDGRSIVDMFQRPRIRSASNLLVGSACCLLLAGIVYAADGQPKAVLRLVDDGFLSGELGDSDAGKALRWQSPLFASPLEFSVNAIKAVEYEV